MYSIKIAFIGNSCCGKSVFIHKYFTGKFEEHYYQTLSVQVHCCHLDTSHGKLCLQIWDVSPKEMVKGTLNSVLSKMDGVIVVGDGSSVEYKKSMRKWVSFISNINKKIPIVGIANKMDLLSDKQEKALPKISIPLFKLSTKHSIDFQRPIVHLVRSIIRQPIIFSSYILILNNQFRKSVELSTEAI